jgi:hypothetical protein
MMPLICLYAVSPAEMRYADLGDWHYSLRGRRTDAYPALERDV